MMRAMTEHRAGFVPYLFVDDPEKELSWCEDVLGFEVIEVWRDDDGTVENVELGWADTELWLDGGGRPDGHGPVWIGVWVDDPDAVHERLLIAGVECDPPRDRPFGVRELQVVDPEGNTFGLMARIPRPD